MDLSRRPSSRSYGSTRSRSLRSSRPSRSPQGPRSRFTFGLLLLTAVTLLVMDLPGTGPLKPVRNGVAAVFRPVGSAGGALLRPFTNGWKGAFGYDEVRKENEELRDRVAELENQDAAIAQLEQEIKDLEALQKLEHDEVPSVAGRVSQGPRSNFDRTVTINLGSDDGVKDGMAVLSGKGLLGRVVATTSGSSTVELITEPSFTVGVRTRANAQGYVSGQGQGSLLSFAWVGAVEGVDAPKLEENDPLYTSGLDDSPYPRDVLVGRIASVTEGEDGTFTYEVKPAADVSAGLVRVLLREPPP